MNTTLIYDGDLLRMHCFSLSVSGIVIEIFYTVLTTINTKNNLKRNNLLPKRLMITRLLHTIKLDSMNSASHIRVPKNFLVLFCYILDFLFNLDIFSVVVRNYSSCFCH